jgi:hypothetical protein
MMPQIKFKTRLLTLLLAGTTVGLVLTGCIAIRNHYVDPVLPKRSYSDLQPKSEPRPLYLVVEFQTFDKTNPRATPVVQEKVSKILHASKVFSTVAYATSESMDRLNIVMNNFGDKGEAVAKGVGTGLTLGMVGSMVTDHYSLNATFQAVGKEPVQKVYRHALHSTIGITTGPEGLTSMPAREAFDNIIQDLILNLLYDLQKESYL